MPDIYSFGVEAISCHAWNKDRTQVALSQNSTSVEIHTLTNGKWSLGWTLSEHTQRVTGIDWGVKTDQIVTCAADCNAYVWTKQKDGQWKPALVVLRMSRAATCVKWSPLENKFAVGSGARLVAVCYYDKENDWWISKQIKKPIRSTITCLDWHPNNSLIACGSSDLKARVYSAHIKEVDDSAPTTNWGTKLTFANLLQEFSSVSGGWIHGVRFSPSGDRLAWVGHDSTICVVDATQGMKLTNVKTEYLPFIDVLWTTENRIVVAGFDCSPVVFDYDGQNIKFALKLENGNSKQGAGAKTVTAIKHFQNLDSKASSDDSSETVLNSIHQNSITWLARHSGGQDKCSKFSTSGTDGQLVTWEAK